MNEKRKRPITPKHRLQMLLEVIAFADEYKVKNVRFHLGMESVVNHSTSYATYKRLKEWLESNGLEILGAIGSNIVSDLLTGIAIRTPKRKCNVFVYFH